MWIQKKANLRAQKQNPIGLKIVYAMTTGGFIGTIFACAVGFVFARAIPIDYIGRSDLIAYIFFGCLFTAIVTSLNINAQKQFAAIFLKITALVLAITPLLDWLTVSQGIITMLKLGNYHVIVVEVMLLSLALFCWLIASRLFVNKSVQTDQKIIEAINISV
jgi:hypothetical protein